MKNSIEMSDTVNVSDNNGIRGVVSCFLNGKHLFTKHNTIVNFGRQFIEASFLKHFITGSTTLFEFEDGDGKSLENYKLYRVYLGTGSQGTISTFSKESFQKIKDAEGNDVKNYYQSFESIAENMEIKLSNKSIQFKCHFDGDENNPATIQELAIFIAPYEFNENTEELEFNDGNSEIFSRLVFDPITVGAGSSFDLEYYIYF